MRKTSEQARPFLAEKGLWKKNLLHRRGSWKIQGFGFDGCPFEIKKDILGLSIHGDGERLVKSLLYWLSEKGILMGRS